MAISKIGLVLAVLYIAFAAMLVHTDRTTSAGGWISLNGMTSYLITFPISAPCELLGMKLDYKRNIDMAAAIGGCAIIIYFIGAGLGWIGKMLVSKE